MSSVEASLEKPSVSTQAYDKFKQLLAELFMFDQADLDFGIYRIMGAKRDEISRFLDSDLLPQVKETLGTLNAGKHSELQVDLEKAISAAKQLGVAPEASPKVQDLRRQLAEINIAGTEEEIFSYLYNFFRRYYDSGDFIAQRRYKPGVYAIPYEGEEVKLHWATRDQYYIKTSEHLRDYDFRLRPEDTSHPMRVHFRLVDAIEGEHGNVKSRQEQERVFILAHKDFISEIDGELTIRFEYRPAVKNDWPAEATDVNKKPPTQKELISIAAKRLVAVGDGTLLPWIAELSKRHRNSQGQETESSRLEVHLKRYTARNTFDYFIHKDLGSFLRRELDFFIKSEIVQLDDIDGQDLSSIGQQLAKVRAIRRIASKVIDFLAQLEGFEKKLWLKKKFVVETSYCITLDRIPEEYYPEIAANETQCEQWVSLYAIDEIKGDAGIPTYSVPLSLDFLKANKNLLVDTSLFDSAFRFRLLANIENLDEQLNGTLIHSDNFQALCLMSRRYAQQVKCIYIDPPYNTDSSSIPYKNNYRHSSWASMMQDRVRALYPTLTRDGAIFVSIDKTERKILEHAMDEVFGPDNRIEELVWAMNTNNSQAPNYSTNHEYVEVYARDRETVEQDPKMFREPKPGFEEVMALVAHLNPSYPSVREIEEQIRLLYERHKLEFREEIEAQGLDWDDEKGNDPWKGLFNYKRAEYRDRGTLVDETKARQSDAEIWVWREDNISMPATKQAASTRDPNHPNYRFYTPAHPITGKPCPAPKSGWKYAYDDDLDSPERKSFVSLDRDNRIVWGTDETKRPQLKRFLREVATNISKSVFQDYSDGEKETSAMFGRSGVFLAPKHSSFVSRFILQASEQNSTIVDCFGGSGSTAHAVIGLNRDDGGSRKYLLVEVGDYFDTVMKPRVLKAVYSKEWKAGEPVGRDGVSHCIKVMRLESYEDTLNNLDVHRSTAQQNLLDAANTQGPDAMREQYILRYMLDVETRGSQSLLNVAAFANPFAYTLKVKRPGGDETRAVNVDLVETFNFLIGLRIKKIAVIDGFTTVTGLSPEGKSVLVIWRDTAAKSNAALDNFFQRQGYAGKELDIVYVNGDNNLEDVRGPSQSWQVRLIEEHFQQLMFDLADVQG